MKSIWSYFYIFLIAMVPIFELRGAIPVGYFTFKMNPFVVYLIAVLGNMLPVPFIYLFARKVLLWGKDKKFIGKFFTFCLKKGENGGRKLEAKAGKGGLFVALMFFVGIPLPVTGAWTGTLAASMLDIDFKRTMLAVFCGVLIAGVLVTMACMGLLGIFNQIFIKQI